MTTGFYLSEVTHPTYELERNGYEVVIISPQGGAVPMDENSRDMGDPLNRDYMGRSDFVEKLENTKPAGAIKASEYQAIVFAGGHGCMWDFTDCVELQTLASDIYKNQGVTAAIGHGVSVLTNMQKDNEYFVFGKKLTGFSNAEEEAVGLNKIVPFLLEDRLKEIGALYSKASLWKRYVVVDDRLVTGQNSMSSQAVGEAVVSILKGVNTETLHGS